MDRIKILLQVSTDVGNKNLKVTGLRQGIKTIFNEEGWRGFYRGNATNIMKSVPESAARFWMYENMKAVLTDNGNKDITLLNRFLAGSSAGLFAQFIVYPLEVVKTRLSVAPKGFYTSIFSTIVRISKYEGPFALYRGLSASLLGIIPYSGVDFTIYSILKEKLNKNGESISTHQLLLCGAFSSSCGQLVSYPLQLARTKLQAQGMPGMPIKYTGVLDCLTKIYLTDGIIGLYRGLLPNFMKAIPSISISYAVFEKTKEFLKYK